MEHRYNGISASRLRGVTWRKATRSSAQGNCVEAARLPGGGAAVRNSKHPDGPALIFNDAEIRAFLESVKDGEFDNLVDGSSTSP
jgi:hypothetical protein